MDNVPPDPAGENGESQPAPKLAAALRDLRSRRVFVPPTLDAAILKTARQQLAMEPARWRGLRRWLFWPGLASSSALLVLLIYLAGERVRSAREEAAMVARQDVNHDGQVDILDAYILTRQIEGGLHPPIQFDLNADGKVDRLDAEVIASQVVKLGKGRRT
jgi:hypothetical protein